MESRSRQPVWARQDESRLPASWANPAVGSLVKQDTAEPAVLQRRPRMPRQLYRIDTRRPQFSDTRLCPKAAPLAVPYSFRIALLIQKMPGAFQFIPMVLEKVPSRRGRRDSSQSPPLFKIDHAGSAWPVDMTVGPMMPVSSFVVDVDADAAALDHLDHGRTLPPQ